MRDLAESSSLLNLPDHLSAGDTASLEKSLAAVWRNNYGRPPGDLEGDLTACRAWFDPVAQGHRLRRNLSALERMPVAWTDPGEPWTTSVGPGKWLMTPEGRCTLDLLSGLPARAVNVVSEAILTDYDRLLAALYRDWSRHRLASVVALLEGTTKPLQVPAAGVVIALLVNRCTTRERALTRFASGAERDAVDRAFFAPVNAFSGVLAPSGRTSGDPRLVSGWMLYEAHRRLGDGLMVEDARGGRDGRVWIVEQKQLGVVDLVARDLCRGRRGRATPELFGMAFDTLVMNLRRELPALAGFGLVHERPSFTRQLRKDFLDAVARHADTA